MNRPSGRALLALALVLLAAGGCASAEKRFEQGLALEQQGRADEAARRYVDALRKDPSLADARDRLRAAGAQAVAEHLSTARLWDRNGSPATAAESLARIGALRDAAREVGVPLDVEADYPAFRRGVLDRAIDGALADASRASDGSHGDAVQRLQHALRSWEPDPEQYQALVDARATTYEAWVESELRHGRYRAAFDRAETAASVVGGRPQTRLRELQEEALRRGTVRVAVLPVRASDRVRDRLPDDAIAELNDALIVEHWSRAPRFVAIADPIVVQREARARGLLDRPASAEMAARVAETVGADLVVVAELDSVETRRETTRETRHPTRTRLGADTAWVFREGREWMRARVSWAVIDVRQRRLVDQGTSFAEAAAPFARATYAGDWRLLMISPEERELFQRPDPGNRERTREMVAGMRQRFSQAVFDRALRDLP